jgi:hypothetical protein
MIRCGDDLDAFADFTEVLYRLALSDKFISDFTKFTIAINAGNREDLYYAFIEDFFA